ncbi:MAG: rubrerythrin family protein [Firmicutes bacterium]|nr:rubrerythrin family protein [Bacillota bacterium]
MKSLKGTRTAENLLKAFAGESQASNRYMIYASVADKEGYKQIRNIFLETADHEREHAKRFWKFLVQGFDGEMPTNIMINAGYPVAQGSTLENLKAAAAGEKEEFTDLYPSFADVAEEEGFPEVAAAFRNICVSEQMHEARYLKLADNVEKDLVFKKNESIVWKCSNCGYLHEGDAAPEACPACVHPKAYFEVFKETY